MGAARAERVPVAEVLRFASTCGSHRFNDGDCRGAATNTALFCR